MILGSKKFKAAAENRKSLRLTSPQTETWLYPNECQLCGKFRFQHKNNRYKPYKITSFSAVDTIKAAAKVKKQSLFNEIEHRDLIAQEFKVHRICYQTLTNGYSTVTAQTETVPERENEPYSTGHFEEVKEYINDIVITEMRGASMKVLHEIYGLKYY